MGTALKLICFDCDSTLSAIEGIDELARVRGPEIFAKVEEQTREAMDGKIPVEAVFGRRLAVIQPRQADVAAVGRQYLEQIEPTAVDTVVRLKAAGWTPLIVSGGFRPIIAPLAVHLGIARVEAVDLYFDAAGNYTGYDEQFPTTRSGGKPEIMRALKAGLNPSRLVMIGDGVSDLETQPEVDLFVGFGRYVERPKVKADAAAFVHSLAELIPLLA
ncbi:MAG: HAD-IB family phosphatase [Lacunisphaera sp.]